MNPVQIICGPTAVGKTAFAIDVALRENAELISADSGQVYRGLDIGTAKPPEVGRKGILFHLIDILNPDQTFSAADFRKLAWEKIVEIQRRGKRPIVVGGTGLYLKILEEGIFEGPPANLEIRDRLERAIVERGIEHLYRRLQEIDPVAAGKMDGYNRQRIVRALEVYELTGRPISEHWSRTRPTSQMGPVGQTNFIKLGLTLPREELNRRIDGRVDGMIRKGWIEEAESLLKKWGSEAPALRILGYRELAAYLQGSLTREQAVALIKTHTRQYAKRQLTWFKREPEIRWVKPLTT